MNCNDTSGHGTADADAGACQTSRKQRRGAARGAKRAVSKKGEVLPAPAATARPSVREPTAGEIQLLVALFNKGLYTEAEALARQITKRFPGNGFGWKVLGAALKAQ